MEITRSLLEGSAKPNAKDVESRTPLMSACEHGQLECARSLVKRGAEVDLKDKASRSALLYACLNNYEDVARWLLKGAQTRMRPTQLALAVAQDSGLSTVKRLVIEGASRAPKAGRQADAWRDAWRVEEGPEALEMRADLSKANSRGVVPLMLVASSSGQEAPEVLKELLKRRADVQTRDSNGWTSFLHACRSGKTAVVKELMALGSDPSEMTKDHKTSLMLAVLEGKVDLVRELIKVKEASHTRQVQTSVAIGTDAVALNDWAMSQIAHQGQNTLQDGQTEPSVKYVCH